jgi:acetamidase/formamidase
MIRMTSSDVGGYPLTAGLLLLMVANVVVDHSSHTVLVSASHIVDVRLPLSSANVHWGYFSSTLTPALVIPSDTVVQVEMATHHACDDWDKMIKDDPGMEDIFTWNRSGARENVRGATGGGDGVHILTGPIYVENAEPGDILQVEILDLVPRRNSQGKTYGSNAAAWWGYQARVNKVDGKPYYAGSFTKSMPGENDEIVTIYEVMDVGDGTGYAVPAYQFEWPILTDPMNVTRDYIAYPGTCVPHDPHACTVPSSDVTDMGWTKTGDIIYYDDVFRAKIPINYHIGCMGLAPGSHDFANSIPPLPTGGNLDNKRIGIGMTMYYPVEVAGGLLSMGDAHAAQGDSELDGTGIETSLTGTFRITVIKAADFTASQRLLNFPLGETETEYVVHG